SIGARTPRATPAPPPPTRARPPASGRPPSSRSSPATTASDSRAGYLEGVVDEAARLARAGHGRAPAGPWRGLGVTICGETRRRGGVRDGAPLAKRTSTLLPSSWRRTHREAHH